MFLTPILAKTLLTDERTYYPLMAILPVVPVIAVSSVFAWLLSRETKHET